jgi:hypothetical protein
MLAARGVGGVGPPSQANGPYEGHKTKPHHSSLRKRQYGVYPYVQVPHLTPAPKSQCGWAGCLYRESNLVYTSQRPVRTM